MPISLPQPSRPRASAAIFLAGAGVHRLHLDTVTGGRIDQIEPDGLGLAGGGVQGDRTGNKGQAQVALPRRTNSHFKPLDEAPFPKGLSADSMAGAMAKLQLH
jgi:hypothetical protein